MGHTHLPAYPLCARRSHQIEESCEAIRAAGFIGALYSQDIITFNDVSQCLELLLSRPDTSYLLAIYAILVAAGDELCNLKNMNFMRSMKNKLCARSMDLQNDWDLDRRISITVRVSFVYSAASETHDAL